MKKMIVIAVSVLAGGLLTWAAYDNEDDDENGGTIDLMTSTVTTTTTTTTTTQPTLRVTGTALGQSLTTLNGAYRPATNIYGGQPTWTTNASGGLFTNWIYYGLDIGPTWFIGYGATPGMAIACVTNLSTNVLQNPYIALGGAGMGTSAVTVATSP